MSDFGSFHLPVLGHQNVLHKQKVLSGAVWVVGALLSTTRMRTVWGSDSVETWSGVLECAASPDYSNFDFRSGHVVRVGLDAQVFHMGETSVVTKGPAWPARRLGFVKHLCGELPRC